MKFLVLAAILWTIPACAQTNVSQPKGNPCEDPTATLQSFALNASGTTAAQIIAASGTAKVFICSLTVQGGGTAPTFSLVSGTGTNCATGQVVLITAIAILTANSAIAFAPPVAVTTASQAVCTLLAGTTPTAKGVLTYVQQ